MIPEFITAEYIEACRKAKHVQGWWSATWARMSPGFPTGGIMAPLGDPGGMRDLATGAYLAGCKPRWSLPPVGYDLQTNVRVGDFIHIQLRPGGHPPWTSVISEASVEWGCNWVSITVGNGANSLTTLAPCVEHGVVFLPRLDQLMGIIWRATTKGTRTFNLDAGGTSSGIIEWTPLMIEMLEEADKALASQDCPAREVSSTYGQAT